MAGFFDLRGRLKQRFGSAGAKEARKGFDALLAQDLVETKGMLLGAGITDMSLMALEPESIEDPYQIVILQHNSISSNGAFAGKYLGRRLNIGQEAQDGKIEVKIEHVYSGNCNSPQRRDIFRSYPEGEYSKPQPVSREELGTVLEDFVAGSLTGAQQQQLRNYSLGAKSKSGFLGFLKV
ncbi:MAG: hypothetical protein K9G62_05635 [Alphaproteobacteria bacterium]|nr:hypothetical protein [Alphaproteobacteria bacterium]